MNLDFLAKYAPFPTHIDYEAQKKIDSFHQRIITLFAIIGFFVGYHYQRYSLTIMIVGLGMLTAFLYGLPPWFFHRRNELKWLPKSTNKKKE
ncbi:hypothetical protein SNEBB_009230 [Seison nebaliae]|nr:hypothetical protein SNEBB_009230 [Seison nebaliae]